MTNFMGSASLTTQDTALRPLTAEPDTGPTAEERAGVPKTEAAITDVADAYNAGLALAITAPCLI